MSNADIPAEVIAEVNGMFDTAHAAAKEFRNFTADQVQEIVGKVALACTEKSEMYAKWAVEETGFGNVGDKVLKNLGGAVPVFIECRAHQFIDPVIDHENKIVSFPKPAGVVLGVIPVTNPATTIFFKALCALFTRNSIILCPHPGAQQCCESVSKLIASTAEEAGAPKGCIQVLEKPNLAKVGALMNSDRTDLILATGGPGLVRAAYSSGNPALGVGAANVPCYVDSSANIGATGKRIADSCCFDNSLPCTTESVVLAHKSIAAELRKSLCSHKTKPAKFMTAEEKEKLRAFVYPEGMLNPETLGLDADKLAAKAGVSVPEGTRTLVVEIDKISPLEPFSKEKMCPILGFMEVNDADDGLEKALLMLEMMGKGHSAVVHAKDPDIIAMFGTAIPVCRITVNAPGFSGSSGFYSNLPSSGVIGTGFFGRSSIDENVTAQDLIQFTRVAYNKDPAEVMGDMEGAMPESKGMFDKLVDMGSYALTLTKILAIAGPLGYKYS